MTRADEPTRRVYLGLGSNLGDRVARLRAGLDALRDGGVALEAVSAVYDTPPWGVTNQPRFANIAAVGRTTLDGPALLRLAKRIERDAGRDFSAERWTERPLDIDLLLLDDEVIDTTDLAVPHERMHERAFVLVPLAEIAPRARHPLFDQTVSELLEELELSEDEDEDEDEDEREAMTVLEPAGWYPLAGA
jgi:2-amino-4-hydroxy-6-hydroxymethyldihydropteridine diphosphokinase